MKLQGMFALAATPFDHTGAIYRTKVLHNFGKWRRTSLSGFIVGAMAGEGPLLAAAEKLELIKLAAEGNTAAILIADVSHEGVHPAAALAHAMNAAGAHAVISRAPHEYRYLPNAEEFPLLYFRALADKSPIPVIIHNAPVITGVDLPASTVAKLSAHPNIAGVLGIRHAGAAHSGNPRAGGQRFRRARRNRIASLGIPASRSQRSRLSLRQRRPLRDNRNLGSPPHPRRRSRSRLAGPHRSPRHPGNRTPRRRRPQARHGHQRLLRRPPAPTILPAPSRRKAKQK